MFVELEWRRYIARSLHLLMVSTRPQLAFYVIHRNCKNIAIFLQKDKFCHIIYLSKQKDEVYMTTFYEWSGCCLGLVGALLLATNTRVSRYGWLAFLGSNIALILLSLAIERNGLLLQQMGFTATSLLGLYRSFWSNAAAPKSLRNTR